MRLTSVISALLSAGFITATLSVPAQTNRPVLLWKKLIGSPIDSSPAIGPDGTIYCGTFHGDLCAINSDGTVRWRFAASAEIKSSPAIATDGTIYFGSRDNFFYAVTPHGQLKWRFKTAGWIDSSAALENDGSIYFGSWDGKLYALRPDGTKKWEFTTGGKITCSPALAVDGTIYFGSHDRKFYALDPAGAKKWDFGTGGEIVSSPAIGSDNTICFASVDGKLYALTPAGKPKWAAHTGSWTKCSPTIDNAGNIYTDGAGQLVSLKSDGTVRWKTDFAGKAPLETSPTLTVDGGILVYEHNGGLAIFDREGKPQSDLYVGGTTEASPALDEKGVAYCGSITAEMGAVRVPSPVASSPWPMFRHDLRHTGKASASR